MHLLQADDIALMAEKHYFHFMANTVHSWYEGWLVVCSPNVPDSSSLFVALNLYHIVYMVMKIQP